MSKLGLVPKEYSSSTFTLTFGIEILGFDVWEDCNEGYVELGPCAQGKKIHYQLYPGQIFDLDILLWPHVAKIWCGSNFCWVRTWQFFQRRWLTFSVTHVFPVRVKELKNHIVYIVPSNGLGTMGANAKSDKCDQVYLPSLGFGERRYFGKVFESKPGHESLETFIYNLIWDTIKEFIPISHLDGIAIDTPQVVTDIRHQDAVLYQIKEAVLKRNTKIDVSSDEDEEPSFEKIRRDSKTKKKEATKEQNKYEIKLTGDTILAGVGRLVPFEVSGDQPPETGEFISLISSTNCPANDDLPICFVNIGKLVDIPTKELKKQRITHLYTRWEIIGDVHDSCHEPVKAETTIDFKDHHVVPLTYEDRARVISKFLDDPFEIQLRGIRSILPSNYSRLFGYDKSDRDFGITPAPKLVNEATDVLIAYTKINAKILGEKTSNFISGELPLYPPNVTVERSHRDPKCTNDIHSIGAPLVPELVVLPHVVLEAQMTLEVSMGRVGCKYPHVYDTFLRLYCLIKDTAAIMSILRLITNMNEEVALLGNREELLTGFALDAGEIIVLYVEGPRFGSILRVWELTEDYYPNLKPLFSVSAKYSTRMYPKLVMAPVPFIILKMHTSLGLLLACPPLYARPALPVPTRSALLKIGRMVSSKMTLPISHNDMPTAEELFSFRLELCAPPKPPAPLTNDQVSLKIMPTTVRQVSSSTEHVTGRVTIHKDTK